MSETATETWRVEVFESGTMVVTSCGPDFLGPWLYVFGPGGVDDDDAYQNRFQCCDDLAKFLNGGPRPAWLDDLDRVTDQHAEAIDHTSISAVGPMIDNDPPRLHWVQDESREARRLRSELMDRVFGTSK